MNFSSVISKINREKNGLANKAQGSFFKSVIQPKLSINQPNDVYEQEADAMADKVMGTPDAALNQKSFFKPAITSIQKKCAYCEEEKKMQSKENNSEGINSLSEIENYINALSGGSNLDNKTKSFFEPRMGYDFSNVKIHTNSSAVSSAKSINALAYTTGNNIVFNEGQFAPGTDSGKKLLGHELTHVVQQNAVQSKQIQRRAAPYIKKVTVHLTPPQNADLDWEGTPPATATGSDHFTVSTGKGYSNPGDEAGTCTRSCCTNADTQCAPPWNEPGRVGACCTYYGNSFWTGIPEEDHAGVKLWTPIQPFYSKRGIALHEYPQVTGQPIGHGCVRMDEPNAKRIFDFSNGRHTNVTIDGRAAPVDCPADRSCSSDKTGQLNSNTKNENNLAENNMQVQPVEGLEGALT